MIRFDDVVLRYAGSREPAVRGISLAAAAGRVTDGADVHDVNAADPALEGHVAPSADHDVRGIVADERRELLVAHVVRHVLGRIGRRSVDHDHLVSVGQRDADGVGELAEARDDDLAELGAGPHELVDPLLLLLVRDPHGVEVERREGAVGHASHEGRVARDEQPPGGERRGAGVTKIASDDEPMEPPALGRGEDSVESLGVAVEVGKAQKPHPAQSTPSDPGERSPGLSAPRSDRQRT